jgi:hypothetical protein
MPAVLRCLLVIVPLLSSAITVAAEPLVGGIRGVVDYCSLGGLDGMRIYVPGRAFVVITAADGRFAFDDLPAGEYRLHYRTGDRLLNHNQGIRVLPGQVTDLSVIAFCDRKTAVVSPASSPPDSACEAGGRDPACYDADGDGVMAARDCNDDDAGIYPGAIERCDGIDNNCNGQVDDNVSVTLSNAIGGCKAGRVSIMRCNQGFGDCDGLSANGCENDLMRDDDNCGSCGNVCSASEICALGSC